jgi:hypothetical protein
VNPFAASVADAVALNRRRPSATARVGKQVDTHVGSNPRFFELNCQDCGQMIGELLIHEVAFRREDWFSPKAGYTVKQSDWALRSRARKLIEKGKRISAERSRVRPFKVRSIRCERCSLIQALPDSTAL